MAKNREVENSISVTLKLRLHPNEEQAAAFDAFTHAFRDACQTVSDFSFGCQVFSRNEVQKLLYHDLRKQTGLTAQVTCSVLKTVAAAYRTADTQLRNRPFSFTDPNTKKKYSCRRDISWLRSPLQFTQPYAVLQQGKDWCFCKDGTVSLRTLSGRTAVRCTDHGFQGYFVPGWKYGEAKLLSVRGKWYLYVSATKDAGTSVEDTHAVVGIDLGLRNILSVSDSSGRKWNIPGDEAARKREKFRRTRASLQAKGTKGAKRVLKRVAGRENRWVADASHCIAKALVQAYGPGTLFVLEDLTGISTNEKNHHGREQTGELCSWPFASLGDKIAYKAMLQGSMCIHVDPYNTSNRCPVCGQVDKKARDRNTHVYTCKRCGHTEDDDLNGADNILELGMRYLCGEEEPSYRKKKKRGPSGSAA